MAYMFAGNMSLNIPGSGGNTDRQMNCVPRDIVQDRANDYLTDLIDKMDYQKGSGVDGYDPKMFFTKPESSASTVTA